VIGLRLNGDQGYVETVAHPRAGDTAENRRRTTTGACAPIFLEKQVFYFSKKIDKTDFLWFVSWPDADHKNLQPVKDYFSLTDWILSGREPILYLTVAPVVGLAIL
jgi:hypothetical protein